MGGWGVEGEGILDGGAAPLGLKTQGSRGMSLGSRNLATLATNFGLGGRPSVPGGSSFFLAEVIQSKQRANVRRTLGKTFRADCCACAYKDLRLAKVFLFGMWGPATVWKVLLTGWILQLKL